MKFKLFESFKNTLVEKGIITESMSNQEKLELYIELYNEGIEFDQQIEELLEDIDHEIYESINESSTEELTESFAFAFAKNPINATKISLNAKKLQKAMIAKAVIELDYSKKMDAIKNKYGARSEEAIKSKETLGKAKKLKEDQAKELVDNIKQRIDDLAGSDDKLRKFASYTKTSAAIAANKKLLKAADGEEAKQLGLQIQKDESKIAKDKSSFKEYDAELKDDEREKAEKAAKKAEDKKGKDKKDSSDSEKTDTEKTDTEKTDTEKNDKLAKAEKKLKNAEKRLNSGQDKNGNELNDKAKEAIKNEIEKHKENIKSLKNKSNESLEISDLFLLESQIEELISLYNL